MKIGKQNRQAKTRTWEMETWRWLSIFWTSAIEKIDKLRRGQGGRERLVEGREGCLFFYEWISKK